MIGVRVTHAAFDVGVEVARLSSAGVGAVASFVGVVRGSGSGGDALLSLTLEHYPAMTQATVEVLARDAAKQWSLAGVIVHHRVGKLVVGAPIVLVACAAPHRRDALDACAYLIDRLKTDAPFWKREYFADGREQWVEARPDDTVAAERWG